MVSPLHGHDFELRSNGEVCALAAGLLEALGAHPTRSGMATLGVVDASGCRNSVVEWAGSGAMLLTGHDGGPPLAPDPPIVPRLRAAEAVLALLSSRAGRRVDIDVLGALGERAALASLSRRGRVSAGGAARLLPARDGWVAVNLARAGDIWSIPAWLEVVHVAADPWETVAETIAERDAAEVTGRAQLLGIAAAAVPEPGALADDPQLAWRGQRGFPAPWLVDGAAASLSIAHRDHRAASAPLVVDLSPLWAGPLCAHLLGRAGARVIKVESVGRPDTMRSSNPNLFDLFHGGHESIALDLAASGGHRVLRELVLRADVVIEESRPRALAQMGIHPEEVFSERPQLTWVSITGYGRSGPWSNRVAFGDDAAAAAGLVVDDDRGTPVFCADAIADPITGVFAAIGALASRLGGGGHLIDIPLREAAGYVCGTAARPTGRPAERVGADAWALRDRTALVTVGEPRARETAARARPFGADTTRVLNELGIV